MHPISSRNVCQACGNIIDKWNNLKKEIDADGKIYRTIKTAGKIYKLNFSFCPLCSFSSRQIRFKESFQPVGKGTGQAHSAHTGNAGDEAQQLREAETVGVGAHTGEAVQDKPARTGHRTDTAGGKRILHAINRNPDFLHRRQECGGG